MHIPENYLSPETCAVMTAAMVPVWVISVKKLKEDLPAEKLSMIGMGAAFSFLGMMFNIPVPGGTTGHAVGGTLIAMLLGPYAGCIAVSVALLLQALIFGDGGILSYGANCFNMAFVLPFVGYFVAKAIADRVKTPRGRLIGAAVGSYAGLNAAALSAAVEFGIQPMLFTDAAGRALYCPYGLDVSIPAMMIAHLTVFGAAEIIYTVGIYGFLSKVSPDMLQNAAPGDEHAGSGRTSLPVKILLGALIILTPLGLLAEGTAWGEWGADEIAGTGAGYTPAGMLEGFEFSALIPDYSIEGLPEAPVYILSAVIGVSLLVIMFKVVGHLASRRH